jgi:hypothetical protein
MTETERAVIGEILTAIENLGASLGALQEALIRKGLVEKTEIAELTPNQLQQSSKITAPSRTALQIPRKR